MGDGLRPIDPALLATAKRVLNQEQYLVWAMAEAGISQRAIADHRGRSKGSISDMLARARRIVQEAHGAEDRWSADEQRRGGRGPAPSGAGAT